MDDEMGESKILHIIERAINIVQQIFVKFTIFIAVCYTFNTYLLQYLYGFM